MAAFADAPARSSAVAHATWASAWPSSLLSAAVKFDSSQHAKKSGVRPPGSSRASGFTPFEMSSWIWSTSQYRAASWIGSNADGADATKSVSCTQTRRASRSWSHTRSVARRLMWAILLFVLARVMALDG